jgi:hypothetical protein
MACPNFKNWPKNGLNPLGVIMLLSKVNIKEKFGLVNLWV